MRTFLAKLLKFVTEASIQKWRLCLENSGYIADYVWLARRADASSLWRESIADRNSAEFGRDIS